MRGAKPGRSSLGRTAAAGRELIVKEREEKNQEEKEKRKVVAGTKVCSVVGRGGHSNGHFAHAQPGPDWDNH